MQNTQERNRPLFRERAGFPPDSSERARNDPPNLRIPRPKARTTVSRTYCDTLQLKNTHLVFTHYGFSSTWREVINQMHPVELEKKLRLPDPSKTMEAIWKLLKRTGQHLDTSVITTSSGVLSHPEIVALGKSKARLEADRRRSQGTSYAQWRIVR